MPRTITREEAKKEEHKVETKRAGPIVQMDRCYYILSNNLPTSPLEVQLILIFLPAQLLFLVFVINWD
jgi:hypothetical protein